MVRGDGVGGESVDGDRTTRDGDRRDAIGLGDGLDVAIGAWRRLSVGTLEVMALARDKVAGATVVRRASG